jgi:hypothetical protein
MASSFLEIHEGLLDTGRLPAAGAAGRDGAITGPVTTPVEREIGSTLSPSSLRSRAASRRASISFCNCASSDSF